VLPIMILMFASCVSASAGGFTYAQLQARTCRREFDWEAQAVENTPAIEKSRDPRD
jgi:hypothetical protein